MGEAPACRFQTEKLIWPIFESVRILSRCQIAKMNRIYIKTDVEYTQKEDVTKTEKCYEILKKGSFTIIT